MAEQNLSKDLVVDDEHVTLSVARCNIALESTWEIGALVDLLRESVPLRDDGSFFVVRALATRIEQLNDIIISALQDEVEETSRLAFLLTRKRGDKVAA